MRWHQGIYFVGPTSKYEHVMGTMFTVSFNIVDRRPKREGGTYNVSDGYTDGSVGVLVLLLDTDGAFGPP